jgi:hypothetical protein
VRCASRGEPSAAYSVRSRASGNPVFDDLARGPGSPLSRGRTQEKTRAFACHPFDFQTAMRHCPYSLSGRRVRPSSLRPPMREGMERRVAHPVKSALPRSACASWRRTRASRGAPWRRSLRHRAALCTQTAVVLPPARALRLLAGSRSFAPRAASGGLPSASSWQGLTSVPGRSPGAARELRLTRPERAGAASVPASCVS